MRNEAVVEGMGSIVNMHADGRRGLSAEAYVQEAFIHHVNGPMIDKAEDGLVKEALDLYFGGRGTSRMQRSVCGMSSAFSVESEVMSLKAMNSKFPFMEQ